MKKVITSFFVLLLIGFLGACGNDVDNIQQSEDEKTKAKTENTDNNIQEEQAKEDDIWTYYEDATWEGTWEGLKFNIQKVVVSDEAPGLDNDGNEITTSAVGVKMVVENTTTDKVYNTYPDQATLVTSTGEQVDADIIYSDHLGGEIHEGVIKEGDIIFYLDRGEAKSIEWIKLTWNSDYSDPDGNYENDKYEETEVKIDLK